MRFLVPLAAALVGACAATPSVEPATQAPAAPLSPGRHDHSSLNGMTANELGQHFGKPRFQVREGDGTKLQFASPTCVLDAYLYPAGGGVPRVAHVDARNNQGVQVNLGSCLASLEAP